MEDGWITIGTELATDKFDKQIVNLEKKMRKEEDKKILVEAKLDTQEAELEKTRAKTDELGDAYQRLAQLKEKVNKTPLEFSEMQGIQQQFGSLDKIGADFDKALSKQDAIEQKVAQTKLQYDGINAKVNEYKTKIEGIKLQKHQADIDKIKNGFNSVGSSVQNAVTRIGKLALGIFAVRSAYMALRRASSDLASYDKQYAANLEYIRFALTQMIAPVLQWIVSMTATLLKYINMIINALFGVNLFTRGSAENFNKMKAGAGGVSKAVKEIKKQLTGFDEINVLTDQSDTGTSAGAGGVGMPDFDLSALEGEPPKWLKWIVDHKDEILATLSGIAAGLIAIKFGLSPLQAIGAALIAGGLVYAFEKLLEYLKDPTWENFGGFLQGIGSALVGLGIIIKSVSLGAIGAGFLVYGTIIKYWNKIHDSMQYAIDYIKENWGSVGTYIADVMQGVLDFFDIAINWIKDSFDGIIEFFKGVFTANWGKVWEGIKKIFNASWEAIKGTMMIFADWTYKIVIKPVIDTFNWLWNGIKVGAEMAFNWIKNIFSGIGAWFSSMINTIIGKFKDMGQRAGEVVAGAFKSVVNGVLGAIERILNTPIRAINGLISAINNIPGINLSRLNTFSLPRLKSGGIINMPNKGTMVGGAAIGGEAGRERSNSFDRPTSNGRIRKRNRKECIDKFNKYYFNEW